MKFNYDAAKRVMIAAESVSMLKTCLVLTFGLLFVAANDLSSTNTSTIVQSFKDNLTNIVYNELSSTTSTTNQTNEILFNNTELRNGTANHFNANDSTEKHYLKKLSTLLKILQLVNFLTTNANLQSLNGSKIDGHSESRSMSSWFGFKRSPSIRRNNYYYHQQHPLPTGKLPPGSNIPKQTYIPTPVLQYPNTFQIYDHYTRINPFVTIPQITDTADIDYWLRFLEDSKFDDKFLMPPLLAEHKSPLDKHYRQSSYSIKKNNKKIKTKNNPERFNKKRIRIQNNLNNNKNTINNNLDYNVDYGDYWSLQNDIGNDHRDNNNNEKKIYRPYDSSPRCDKFTEDICIDDFEYPENAIIEEIFKRKDLFRLMYTEVNGDVPLVDGLTKDMDESFSQDYYYSNNDNEFEDYDVDTGTGRNKSSMYYDQSNQEQRIKVDSRLNQSGYVCRSEVLYAKPKLARNLKKKWRVIVNAGDFTQTIRMEKCYIANSECRFIADHKYSSRCVQVNSIHRLLVFEKGKGFYIDSFRIPTACTCHVYSIKQNQQLSPSTSQNHQSLNQSVESNLNAKLNKNNNNNNNNNNQLWSLMKDRNSLDQTHQSTLNNVNDNLSNPNNLIILPEQQQSPDVQTKTQQAINILNNQALLKLFPQLSTVDSEAFQQLFNAGDAAITTGTGSATGTVADLATVQHLLNLNRQTNPASSITAQLPDAMPQYQLTLTEKLPGSTTNVQSTELMNGMTSIVTPYRGQPAAPVVQVIHMPLTATTGFVPTETISAGVEEKLFTWPFKYVQDNETVLPYTKFLVSASNNNYQQKIGPNSGPDHRNSTSGSKQTGLKNNANKNENYRTNDTDNNGDEETETKPFVNKKINFSYHPILEYIVN